MTEGRGVNLLVPLIDSIDAYRTQRQSKLPAIQSVTPAVQRRAPEKSRPPTSINTKEKIAVNTTISSFKSYYII